METSSRRRRRAGRRSSRPGSATPTGRRPPPRRSPAPGPSPTGPASWSTSAGGERRARPWSPRPPPASWRSGWPRTCRRRASPRAGRSATCPFPPIDSGVEQAAGRRGGRARLGLRAAPAAAPTPAGAGGERHSPDVGPAPRRPRRGPRPHRAGRWRPAGEGAASRRAEAPARLGRLATRPRGHPPARGGRAASPCALSLVSSGMRVRRTSATVARDDTGADTAGAAQPERRDHASARPGRGLHRHPQRDTGR